MTEEILQNQTPQTTAENPQEQTVNPYLPPVFERTVTFKDHTVLLSRAGHNETTDELWIWPDEPLTFPEAFLIFSDPEKTDHIRVDYSAMEYQEFDHYTRLTAIQENAAGKLSIRLTKPRS